MYKKMRNLGILLLCAVLFIFEIMRMDVVAANQSNMTDDNEVQIIEENEGSEIVLEKNDEEVEENNEETSDIAEEDGETDEENGIDEVNNEVVEEDEGENDEKENQDDGELGDEVNDETNEGEEIDSDVTEVSDVELVGTDTQEIGNVTENIIENEIITISFDDTYGKGSYAISDAEYQEASGEVVIELTEESNVQISVKAAEGCFIVSDSQEAYMKEMQITLSWDNREELRGKVIQFETQLGGMLLLSNDSGVYGNTFTGQAVYEEGVNDENTYIEWIYESSDLELSEETGAFNVLSKEEKTTVIGGKIYRNDVCLGMLTEAEYSISEIDNNNLLVSCVLICENNSQIDLMDSGEVTVGKDLNFQIKVNTEYISSISHEVEKILITYGSQTEEMNSHSSGKYTLVMDANSNDKTEDILEITIVLKKGGEIAISTQKKIKVDREAPTVDVYLIRGDETVKKDWLSQNIDEGIKLQVDVKDTEGIETCNVTLNSNNTNLAIPCPDTNDSYYVELNLKEQIAIYHIVVTDVFNNCTEIDYTVKIDNTLPSESVIVDFLGDGLIFDEEEVVSGYRLGDNEGSVWADGHITMSLKIADDGKTDDTCSGISKVEVFVETTTTDGVSEKKFTFDCNNEKEKAISFCVTDEQSEPEMNYQIKKVIITDQAGNIRELSKVEECVDGVKYLVDGRLPVVTYSYGDGSVIDEENGKVYMNENASGTIEVTDMNLEDYEIEVCNVEGYLSAEIGEAVVNETKKIYTFSLGADGKYQVNTKISEIQGENDATNSSPETYTSAIMIVDKSAPVIEVKLSKESGTELIDYAEKCYAESIKANVTITDMNIDIVDVKLYCNDTVQTGYTVDDFLQNEEDGIYTLDCNMNEDGEYYLEVLAIDKSGRESSFISEAFFIDRTAPKVSITYDNNNALNEIYYNNVRTATIKVEDISFSEGSVDLKIDTAKGTKPTLSEWTEEVTGANKCFTAHVSFMVDDAYDVSFSCNDKAGNRSEVCDGGYFIIDRTSPIVSIDFDNISNKNQFYYNADRTARITIEDLSFDKNSFAISNSEVEGVIAVNGTGVWSETEVYHTTEILCSEEGAYQFSVSVKDLAGNAAVTADSSYFIIDKTAPEIEIVGVTDASANQGEVLPLINYSDKYISDDNSQVLLSGYKNGVVNIGTSLISEDGNRSVQYEAFPKTKQMDDIYTLSVHIEDKAGNQSEEEYRFSVNRFGSTFTVNDATAELVNKYYTNKEQAVEIIEVNVDKLQKREITISYNGEPKTLKEGVDYDVTAQGSNATWKSYTYTVAEENFKQEGQYAVTVFTQDEANNQSDNNVQGLEIAFAVDKTAPSIVVSGLENDGIYEQSELIFNMDIQDNVYLESARVLVNGKEVQSFSGEELQNVVSYKLAETDECIDIAIEASDIVGNTSQKCFSNILIKQKQEILSKEVDINEEADSTLQNDNISSAEQVEKFKLLIMLMAAGVMIILLIAIKKKKEQEK